MLMTPRKTSHKMCRGDDLDRRIGGYARAEFRSFYNDKAVGASSTTSGCVVCLVTLMARKLFFSSPGL
jgi:hypothetical protein